MSGKLIVRLWSGLGNQLFQLAFGLAKAERSGRDLVLETTAGDRTFDKIRSFVDIEDLPVRTMPVGFTGRLYRLGCRFSPTRPVTEPHWHYSPSIADRSGGRFIGYWQSEKYFEDQSIIIRQRIDPGKIPLEVSLAGQVRNERPVSSIHLRRGDYLDARFGGRYATVHENYYRKSIDLMRRLQPGVAFRMFSDDPDWGEKTFGDIGDLVVVRGNTDLQDFRLMSECDHHIIGNSTFSWWAAWLSGHPEKTVIMPKQWSAEPGRKIDDIYMHGALILYP